jgi:16S rRNA (adenine1518-N6/adenine1519-N6)-dimethyltransferase
VYFDIENHIKPQVADEERFFKVVRAAFGQRRKTLVNALSSAFDTPKDDIRHVVKKVCGNENIRGENLDIDKFSEISELI